MVRQSGKMLHVVPNLHFVDSPEWFGVAADDFFQISATALEETKGQYPMSIRSPKQVELKKQQKTVAKVCFL